jgi:hypothetical protein
VAGGGTWNKLGAEIHFENNGEVTDGIPSADQGETGRSWRKHACYWSAQAAKRFALRQFPGERLALADRCILDAASHKAVPPFAATRSGPLFLKQKIFK